MFPHSLEDHPGGESNSFPDAATMRRWHDGCQRPWRERMLENFLIYFWDWKHRDKLLSPSVFLLNVTFCPAALLSVPLLSEWQWQMEKYWKTDLIWLNLAPLQIYCDRKAPLRQRVFSERAADRQLSAHWALTPCNTWAEVHGKLRRSTDSIIWHFPACTSVTRQQKHKAANGKASTCATILPSTCLLPHFLQMRS